MDEATEAIVAMANKDGDEISAEYDWPSGNWAARHGALTARIRDMEQRNETPTEYVRRVRGKSGE